MSEQKKKMSSSVDKIKAAKETQAIWQRSDLPRSEAVQKICRELEADPANAQLWMEKGLALAKQMLCVEATEAFSVGLSFDPFNWRLLRHRGHRHLSTYRFHDAAADFELASRLYTKDWDVWYHLGLSYYLIGDFKRANAAYEHCLAITEPADDGLVAIVDWKWLTLMRLGEKEQAAMLLKLVDENTECGENQSYKDRILAYKGLLTPEQVLTFDNPEYAGLELSTRGYGMAMLHYFRGETEQAKALLKRILADDSFWTAFGYLATYQEIKEGRLGI